MTSSASRSTGGKVLQSQVRSVTRSSRLLLGTCCITNALWTRERLAHGSSEQLDAGLQGGSSGDGARALGAQVSPLVGGNLVYISHKPLQLPCSFPSRLEGRKPRHLGE